MPSNQYLGKENYKKKDYDIFSHENVEVNSRISLITCSHPAWSLSFQE